MKLHQLRDFIAVVEHGGMASASRALGYSQPSITKSIRSLEEDLKAQLVQRTSRGVVATRYGRAFYARAKAAQAELEKGRQEIGQLTGSEGGFVAVGTGPVVADLVLPEAIGAFRIEYPQAELRIFEGFAHTLIPLLRDSTLELAITARLPQFRRERGLRFRPLFFHDRVVTARKGHPLVRAKSLHDLAGAQWLSFEPRALLESEFTGRHLPKPQSIILCESYTGFIRLLETSDMVGILPASALGRPQATQALRQLYLSETLSSITVGLFSRSDTPLTPAAAAMARALTTVGQQVASSAKNARPK